MQANHRHRQNDVSRDAGIAMLEFVLMLPFIWIILALTLNFGLAFLEKQRSIVALREVALRTADSRASGQNRANDDAVRADTLRPRRMAATFSLRNSDTCPRIGGGGVADQSGLLRQLDGFMGRMSTTQVYEATTTGQPLVGRLLPKPAYEGCFAVGANPWTYHDIGGSYLSLMGRMMRNLVGL